MRQAYFASLQPDRIDIADITFNFHCRDEIIPILVALQHIYSKPEVRDRILQIIREDVNPNSSPLHGREGFSYWQILVLAAVRLGCNFDYDRLQDLAENHRKLRQMMQLSTEEDDTSFNWKRIRDNLCKLKPETIDRISHLLVAEGHRLQPQAAKTARVDSFVMETNIHYPTESSLIWDGIRVIIRLAAPLAENLGEIGWRQHDHLQKKIRNLHQEIARMASSKSPRKKSRLKRLYRRLIRRAEQICRKAEKLQESVDVLDREQAARSQVLGEFLQRTRQVIDTARRRVIRGEQVLNQEKLFSIFETHTQLYRRGKAGKENQFGRLVLIFEDSAGFVTHHCLMDREETDAEVAVRETKIIQARLNNAIERISFDRGFDSPSNEEELKKCVPHVCLPKKGKREYEEQRSCATEEFRTTRRRHPGVESAIGAIQSGNGLARSRDRTEIGFSRYLSLAILGRNLHTLGKLLIAQQSPDSVAAETRRQAAA